MSEMEEKLGAILSNPQMMQQIMSMAQAMSPPQEAKPEQPPEPAPPAIPDFSVMQKLAGVTRQSGICAGLCSTVLFSLFRYLLS